MPSKRDIINKIEKFELRIREHENKLRHNPQSSAASHWKNEIAEWMRNVENLRRTLNEGGYEEYCFQCKKAVIVRNSKCSRCNAYLG